MSNMRQDRAILARSNGVGFYTSHRYRVQRFDDWHQLVCASHGTLTVAAADSVWVVPPQRAVLVPSGVSVEMMGHGPVTLSCIYLASHLVDAKQEVRCRVMSLDGLVRELVQRTVTVGTLFGDDPHHVRLVELILDLLEEQPSAGLSLPVPRDRRLRAALATWEKEPDLPVAELPEHIHCSRRTLERLCRDEFGCSPAAWHRQVAMLAALRFPAEGETVSRVSLAVGYSTPSAFIHAFRQTLGTTPGAYFRSSA